MAEKVSGSKAELIDRLVERGKLEVSNPPPPPPNERRTAPDGKLYTKTEFHRHFGGYAEWDAAATPARSANGAGPSAEPPKRKAPPAKLVPAMADEAPLAFAAQLAEDAAAAFPHSTKGPKPQAAGAPKASAASRLWSPSAGNTTGYTEGELATALRNCEAFHRLPFHSATVE